MSKFFVYDKEETLKLFKSLVSGYDIKVYDLPKHPFYSNLDISHINTESNPDYYLVPVVIDRSHRVDRHSDIEAMASSLQFFNQIPNKHIFFLLGDNWSIPKSLNRSIVFQVSCNNITHGVALPYHADESFGLSPDIKDAKIDILFQCWPGSSPIRSAIKKFLANSKFKTLIKTTNEYYECLPQQDQIDSRRSWIDNLFNSKFVLCPRGGGLNSIRFFETILAGRIPILIADKAKLPLKKHIDYNEFIIKVSENNIDYINTAVEKFMDKKDIVKSSAYAKQVSFEYFSKDGIKCNFDKYLKHRNILYI